MGMVCISWMAGQPAKALNLQAFDLRWDSWSTSKVIRGQIMIDLDAVATNLPFDNSSSPAGLPAWIADLVIDVPGTGPGAGRFTRSDYNGLIWNDDNAAISYDFTSELVGQYGWGTSCATPGCDFRLLTSDPLAPFGDAPFQMYTSVGGSGDYLGLQSFAPSPPTLVYI